MRTFKLKSTLTVFLLLFCTIPITTVLSQEVIKFRAKYISTKEYDKWGWSEWTEWKECNTLIVVNPEDERILVYLEDVLTFDIYDTDREVDGTKRVFSCYAIDDDGSRCRIRLVYDEYDDNKQMYVDYDKFIVALAIKPMSR